MKGLPYSDAIVMLRLRSGEFDEKLIEALADIKPETAKMELRKILASKLTIGMILQQEVKTRTGMLVVPKGQEITQALLIKLDNYSRVGAIDKELIALVPV